MLPVKNEDNNTSVLIPRVQIIKLTEKYGSIQWLYTDFINNLDSIKKYQKNVKDKKENKNKQMEPIEIYFSDLNDEGKEKVLKGYELESADEGNFDVLPLFILNVDDNSPEQGLDHHDEPSTEVEDIIDNSERQE
jgi:hypothetical protein